jgi:hypothetical protein
MSGLSRSTSSRDAATWLSLMIEHRAEERRLQNISVEKLDRERTDRESPFLAFPMCRDVGLGEASWPPLKRHA